MFDDDGDNDNDDAYEAGDDDNECDEYEKYDFVIGTVMVMMMKMIIYFKMLTMIMAQVQRW